MTADRVKFHAHPVLSRSPYLIRCLEEGFCVATDPKGHEPFFRLRCKKNCDFRSSARPWRGINQKWEQFVAT
jgi:hypothetical protein